MRPSWRERFPPVVRGYVACGLVAVAVFYALPPGLVKDTVWYELIGLSAVVAIVAGTMLHRPRHRLPWLFFAAGLLLWVAGDELFSLNERVFHDSGFPSAADALYLCGYPVLAAGLWLLLRARSTGRDWGSLIDAAIVTVAPAVVVWVLLIVPYTNDTTLTGLGKAVSIAYPLGDVLLLALAVRVVLGGGVVTVSYVFLGLAITAPLVADPIYTYLALHHSYGSGNAIDGIWILAYVLWGAAGLHPSMRDVAEPAPEAAPKLTRMRLALLAVASLTAPVVIFFHRDRVAIAGSMVLFLLVLARLAGIVGRFERAVAREARLRAAAATLVAATSDEEIHEAAVATAVAFAGGTDAQATLFVETTHGRAAVASAGRAAEAAAVEYPLLVRDESRGALEVRSPDGVAREDAYALETLAAQVALALETVARAREQAERASEARFRSLVQNSSDVIAIVQPDTTIGYLTPSVRNTLGYAVDELDGTKLVDIVHPDDRERALVACGQAAAIGGLHTGVELRLRHADGHRLHTETVISSRLDDDTIGGLVLTTRDVTVRKELEAADAERARVRDVFSRFVPESVVDDLLSQTGGLRLGGETLQGTIMFTDLRNFTSFSESRPAGEVIEVINRALAEQTETIMTNGGTIIAYLGDGIMAAFGAPIEQPDHADRALAAARELVALRLPELNDWMRERGYGDGFRMGIGLNTGPFVSGNVGSERRLEYTAIGDVCNTASRIQELTKGTRHMLLFSESTRASLTDAPPDLVDVGATVIRGRREEARLWSLESVSDAAPA